MSKTKKGVVPRLRFPEFRDAGPWEVKRLGELFHERNERDGTDLELLSVTISDGVVRASDLERNNNASADLSNYKKVYPGDIVYNSMRMWQGASGVSHWHGIVSPAYTVVTPVDNQNPLFWAYHFKLWHSIDKFARYSQGLTSDTWNLKFPAFSAIKMAFPRDPEEQQKIAACLSSLDALIELEGKKLEALKQHKKGLLQQLFPREGETTPRLRFPEFRDAGPWEVKRLGEIANITMGVSPPSSTYNDRGVGFPLLQGNADIYNRRSNPRLFTSEITKQCYIGDILLSVRAPVGDVAKSDHEACIGRGICALRATPEVCEQEYLYQWLLSYESKWIRVSQGGTFDSINNLELRNHHVCFPTLPEQQKIADCLSSLDELIELEGKKHEALKQHKKGLMQQLFPQEVE